MATEWIPILTLAANIGFSVVVAWYLLSRAIPSMQERFSNDLLAQRESYEASLKVQRDDHHNMMIREAEILNRLVNAATERDHDIIKKTADQVARILALSEEITRQRIP